MSPARAHRRPVHLRDVRENLAAPARETGDVLHTAAGGLRAGEWGAGSAAGWSDASARLLRRVDALDSARSWSRESPRLAYGPPRRAPPAPPPEREDRRRRSVAGDVSALTRTLAVAADEHRSPTVPEGAALDRYGRPELIGDSCHAQAPACSASTGPGRGQGAAGGAGGAARPAVRGAARARRATAGGAAVLGTPLLRAENLWADVVPAPAERGQARETGAPAAPERPSGLRGRSRDTPPETRRAGYG
ncbi:hypothetical protein [Streptomyces sp. AD55]|uniref:hypothetical protein n=1 Tax=Streptomyces sp. AD55 TaxID=3242895 RepID=UPI003529D08B